MLDVALLLLNTMVLVAIMLAFVLILVLGARYVMRAEPLCEIRPQFATIFDEVAYDLELDPRTIIRSQKEMDAKNTEFFDKIEEYRNDITG